MTESAREAAFERTSGDEGGAAMGPTVSPDVASEETVPRRPGRAITLAQATGSVNTS
jgi:hypothetical protein